MSGEQGLEEENNMYSCERACEGAAKHRLLLQEEETENEEVPSALTHEVGSSKRFLL